VSRIDNLLDNYQRFVQLPWAASLAPAQRVWMAVYPPEDERRLRLHLPDFETATKHADHGWSLIDITTAFETWMAAHEYRDAYFANPSLMTNELPGFLNHLVGVVRAEVEAATSPTSVVAILGAGSLYGLGDKVKVSALIEGVQDTVEGRLIVFFPGEREENVYRLLSARDGWNYLATPITSEKAAEL
jgi:hypothetical protein